MKFSLFITYSIYILVTSNHQYLIYNYDIIILDNLIFNFAITY